MSISQAALRLVATRLRHQTAKQALHDYRKKHGGCTDATEWVDDCFRSKDERLLWCKVCLGSQPLWAEYHAAANAAGAAMRTLMQVCSKEQS